ncbi:MAG TPA: right-handed parallel beta-helix repeat-containing protein [Sphingobacteriaceae bacterium]|nr:right-handed parallel beta-helix repeat-containing protein [Sphingobacteriaceae bacterium]
MIFNRSNQLITLLGSTGIVLLICLSFKANFTDGPRGSQHAVTYPAGIRYYVDAVKGNDRNSGKSVTKPWRTLQKVSNTAFSPGDHILFRSGQTFNGNLIISTSGTKNRPIVYSSYNGKRAAVINGSGLAHAIYAYNKSQFELNNLAVTNFKKSPVAKEDLFNGIYIVNEDGGTLDHIHFKNIRVFDVNSSHQPKDEGKTDQTRYYGGVQFYTKGTRVRSSFNDVHVENSIFENLGRTGFNFRSDWDDRSMHSKFGDDLGNGTKDNWTPNTGVVFRKNIFRSIAGNGLIVRVAKDPLIEYNLFDSCGTTISGNAVFNFNTDNCIYQFNEARNTIYNPGDTDARGIDSDYRTKNTIIQYNYLHHNQLGGVTATGGPGVGPNPTNFNLGTIIRYNIIENNARQGAYFSGRVEGLEVYNNVFYADAKYDDVVVLKLNRWTVYPNGASFRNNIFFYEGRNPSYSFGNSTNISFSNNLYRGITPPLEFIDALPFLANPLFQAPGKGPEGYKLKSISPAIQSGIVIPHNGTRDYYGNKMSETVKPNIGIYNGIIN